MAESSGMVGSWNWKEGNSGGLELEMVREGVDSADREERIVRNGEGWTVRNGEGQTVRNRWQDINIRGQEQGGQGHENKGAEKGSSQIIVNADT